MRRTIVLLTAMAMTLLVATSVALALATVDCSYSGNCYGTNAAEFINGGDGNNIIYSKGGEDKSFGDTGDDFILGEDGNDSLYGGIGNDVMAGGYGNDIHIDATGNDTYDGGPNYDQYRDGSMFSADTYLGFKVNSLTGAPLDTGVDVVNDSGGAADVLDLSTLNRSQVSINWVDRSTDADANLDYLSLWQKGTTTNNMQIFNYFDNKGGTGRGVGAIEIIKFKNGTYTQFPIPQG